MSRAKSRGPPEPAAAVAGGGRQAVAGSRRQLHAGQRRAGASRKQPTLQGSPPHVKQLWCTGASPSFELLCLLPIPRVLLLLLLLRIRLRRAATSSADLKAPPTLLPPFLPSPLPGPGSGRRVVRAGPAWAASNDYKYPPCPAGCLPRLLCLHASRRSNPVPAPLTRRPFLVRRTRPTSTLVAPSHRLLACSLCAGSPIPADPAWHLTTPQGDAPEFLGAAASHASRQPQRFYCDAPRPPPPAIPQPLLLLQALDDSSLRLAGMALPPLSPANKLGGVHHARRPSARRPSAVPASASPRTPCPRDGDAFSYNPAHLAAWYMPNDLWVRLPKELLDPLARLQHAGAAVLTGFERLEAMGAVGAVRDEGPDEEAEEERSYARHDSGYDDKLAGSGTDRTVLGNTTQDDARPHDDSSIFLTNSTLQPIPTNPLPSPISPWTLNPLDPPGPPSLSASATNTSLTPPLSPTSPLPPPPTDAPATRPTLPPKDFRTTQYLAELAALRSDSLVRLRHCARAVELAAPGARPALLPAAAAEFGRWWDGMRARVGRLEQRGRGVGAGGGGGAEAEAEARR